MPNYGSARCDGDHERDDFEQKKPRSRGAWSFWESVQYGQYPRCQPGTALLRRTRGAPVAYPAFSSSPLPPSPPAEKTTDRLDERCRLAQRRSLRRLMQAALDADDAAPALRAWHAAVSTRARPCSILVSRGSPSTCCSARTAMAAATRLPANGRLGCWPSPSGNGWSAQWELLSSSPRIRLSLPPFGTKAVLPPRPLRDELLMANFDCISASKQQPSADAADYASATRRLISTSAAWLYGQTYRCLNGHVV
jgi:hypothetical protein